MAKAGSSPWDLTALFNAADPKAGIAERHLWVIRLLEWLRQAPLEAEARTEARTMPLPGLRLRYLLGLLERDEAQRLRAAERLRILDTVLTATFWWCVA